MELDQIRRIAVIGAGLMGHGIALEFAAAGYPVAVQDINEQILARARDNIGTGLATLVEAGAITAEQAAAAPARMRFTTVLKEAAGDADVVIEAASENIDVKHMIFRQLDALCPPEVILASNSSTLMPSRLAPAVTHPERLLVAHYWNPPYLLPLVEIVGSEHTDKANVQTMYALLEKIGKQPVIMQKEAAGFIGNRLQFALFREALNIVGRGIATPEDVDRVVRSSFGRRLAVAGPFEVFDLAGYDVIYGACTYLFPDLDNSTMPPALLQERMDRGELGVKAGKGFYTWTRESGEALRKRIAAALTWLNRNSSR